MSNLNGGLSGSGTLRGALGGGGGSPQPQDVYWDDILDKPEFATVATSGSYNDLLDKPTIPPAPAIMTGATAQSNGVAGYVTQPQAGDQDKFLNGGGQWVTPPSNGVNYSTNEQVIGTWIDGDPLYQKTIIFTGSFTGNVTIGNLNINNLKKIVKNNIVTYQDDGAIKGMSFAHPTSSNNYGIFINSSLDVNLRGGSSSGTFTEFIIIVEYTKNIENIGG